jgi:hypothetical protein
MVRQRWVFMWILLWVTRRVGARTLGRGAPTALERAPTRPVPRWNVSGGAVRDPCTGARLEPSGSRGQRGRAS